MKEQWKERVELHLNTSTSEDISVITPKEAIQAAVRMGHRAVAVTCLNSVQDFSEMEKNQKKYGNGIKVIYGVQIQYTLPNDDWWYNYVTVLAKDREGLKALYRLISALEDHDDMLSISKEQLIQNRAHLLLGSHHYYGELYRAVRYGESDENIKQIASFYDYIELFPRASAVSARVNTKLYQLGKDLGIPVVAVGNCHYIDPEDSICKQVIHLVRGVLPEEGSTHFRTTEEMLQEFSYLGEEAAYEVVVTNPNKLADQIENIYPTSCPHPTFTLPDANADMHRICQEKLHQLYGNQPPRQATDRLEAELLQLRSPNHASLYMIAHHFAIHLHNTGELVSTRGTIGSTLTAYLLGISNINPLPAHYRCPRCGYAEFVPESHCGYDLPKKACPHCGGDLQGDGHNIPYESCTGLDGELEPYATLNTSAPIAEAGEFLADFLGKDRVAFAGTVGCLGYSLAEAYIRVYEDLSNEKFSKEETDRIATKLSSIKKGEGRYPGGLVLLPDNMEFEDLTPIRKMEQPVGGIENITHMSYHDIDTLPKLDAFTHHRYTCLNKLFQRTGTKPEDIDYSDPMVYQLFYHLDTQGVPDFFSRFCRNILCELEDIRFSDLVRICGMAHSTGAWTGNGEKLMKEHPFRELISNREHIFLTLQGYGLDRHIAYSVMCTVRKGKFCFDNEHNQKLTDAMRCAGVPEWYIDSMKQIHYLFPLAHTVAYTKLAYDLAWFKCHYPQHFYDVCLSVLDTDSYLAQSSEELEQQLSMLNETDYSVRFRWEIIALILEARERGFQKEPA